MARLRSHRLQRSLGSLGYEYQTDQSDLIFVRPSEVESLFERVEFSYAGRQRQALILTVAVSVVRWLPAQWRGLLVRGSDVQRFYPDPAAGYIELTGEAEWDSWLDDMVSHISDCTKAVAHDKGPALLAATETARKAAADALDRLAFHRLAVPSRLSDEVKRAKASLSAIHRLSNIPQLDLAIGALVLADDGELRDRIESEPDNSQDPVLRQIRRTNAIPDSLAWKIMLIVDRLLATETWQR